MDPTHSKGRWNASKRESIASLGRLCTVCAEERREAFLAPCEGSRTWRPRSRSVHPPTRTTGSVPVSLRSTSGFRSSSFPLASDGVSPLASFACLHRFPSICSPWIGKDVSISPIDRWVRFATSKGSAIHEGRSDGASATTIDTFATMASVMRVHARMACVPRKGSKGTCETARARKRGIASTNRRAAGGVAAEGRKKNLVVHCNAQENVSASAGGSQVHPDGRTIG